MKLQPQRVAHQGRFADQVVTAELGIIDIDVGGRFEIFLDRPHEQQVIVDVAFRRRASKKQHGRIVTNIKSNGVVMAGISH